MAFCAFSRKRKFGLKDLVITILCFNRTGVKVEIDRLFKYFSQDQDKIKYYTKSAFTQARKKLNASAFVYLREKLLAYFDEHAPTKRCWSGHRVIAIDGSSLNLPSSQCLNDHFGMFSNQGRSLSVGARISVAYDVCNHLVIDTRIGKANGKETVMAKEHLPKLCQKTDLLLFDRGYPGFRFFAQLQEEGFRFCFRLSSSWKSAYCLLEQKDDVDWSIPEGYKVPNSNYEHACLQEKIEGLRLVKIPLGKDGNFEVLVTNLTDRNLYPIGQLKELYHLRWSVEECYKRIKQVSQMEYFSGRTVHAIEQDFEARIVLLNMMSMIEMQSLQPQLDKQQRPSKYKRQINRTQTMAKIKDFFYDIFYSQRPQMAITKMLSLALECYDIIRPNRSFKRPKVFRQRRKPLAYKAF